MNWIISFISFSSPLITFSTQQVILRTLLSTQLALPMPIQGMDVEGRCGASIQFPGCLISSREISTLLPPSLLSSFHIASIATLLLHIPRSNLITHVFIFFYFLLFSFIIILFFFPFIILSPSSLRGSITPHPPPHYSLTTIPFNPSLFLSLTSCLSFYSRGYEEVSYSLPHPHYSAAQYSSSSSYFLHHFCISHGERIGRGKGMEGVNKTSSDG